MKNFKRHLSTAIFVIIALAILVPIGIWQGKKDLYIQSLEQKIQEFEQAEKEKMDVDTAKMADDNEGVMHKISSIESSHNPNAVSPAGARGQYQIMKSTWDECVELMKVDWDYDTCWNDPVKNRAVGEYYFFKRIPAMLKAYDIPDNTETRLACYNGGIGRIVSAYRENPTHWKDHLPQETQQYIIKYTKREL